MLSLEAHLDALREARSNPLYGINGQEERMLGHFRANRGQLVSKDDLIRALWPDPDREPASAEALTKQVLTRLRRRGVTIETVTGWRLPK